MTVEEFAEDAIRTARKRGDDAAMTFVMLAAARAAAEISARRPDGSIDEHGAREALGRAAARLTRLP